MTIKFRLYNGDAKSPFSSTFVNPKDFKTGSTGYFVNGKVDLPVGCTEVQAEFAGDTDMRFIVPNKDFSTGSKGFWQGEKVALDDGLYQMQVQMTLVGSGPQKKDEDGNLKPKAKNPSGRTYQYQVQLVKIGSKTVKAEFTVDAKGSIDSVDMAALKAGGSVLAADVAAANAAIDALKL